MNSNKDTIVSILAFLIVRMVLSMLLCIPVCIVDLFASSYWHIYLPIHLFIICLLSLRIITLLLGPAEFTGPKYKICLSAYQYYFSAFLLGVLLFSESLEGIFLSQNLSLMPSLMFQITILLNMTYNK